jgi:proteasome lid subunit RPN8/RPN11
VLFGSHGNGGDLVALGQLRIRNADGRPGRFAIADADLYHAERVAAHRRLALIAWLHSHPGGCTALSRPDRQFIALSRLPWVVAASRDDGTTAFAAYSAGTAELITVLIR